MVVFTTFYRYIFEAKIPNGFYNNLLFIEKKENFLILIYIGTPFEVLAQQFCQ